MIKNDTVSRERNCQSERSIRRCSHCGQLNSIKSYSKNQIPICGNCSKPLHEQPVLQEKQAQRFSRKLISPIKSAIKSCLKIIKDSLTNIIEFCYYFIEEWWVWILGISLFLAAISLFYFFGWWALLPIGLLVLSGILIFVYGGAEGMQIYCAIVIPIYLIVKLIMWLSQ
jgi:hypothetical protein